MILTLALRSLLSRPIRSAVLAGGFGLGVSVMTALLGIGGVILDQARAPALVGGGDVVIGGAAGRIGSAKFVLSSVLGSGSLSRRVAAASPGSRANLYLIDDRGATPIVGARLASPASSDASATPRRAALHRGSTQPPIANGLEPSAEDILRAMDRFHPIPDVPARARVLVGVALLQRPHGVCAVLPDVLRRPAARIGQAAVDHPIAARTGRQARVVLRSASRSPTNSWRPRLM